MVNAYTGGNPNFKEQQQQPVTQPQMPMQPGQTQMPQWQHGTPGIQFPQYFGGHHQHQMGMPGYPGQQGQPVNQGTGPLMRNPFTGQMMYSQPLPLGSAGPVLGAGLNINGNGNAAPGQVPSAPPLWQPPSPQLPPWMGPRKQGWQWGQQGQAAGGQGFSGGVGFTPPPPPPG